MAYQLETMDGCFVVSLELMLCQSIQLVVKREINRRHNKSVRIVRRGDMMLCLAYIK